MTEARVTRREIASATGRRGRLGRACGVSAAVLSALAAAPASAELCDMRVYDSSYGEQLAESEQVFAPNAQFQVCFRARKDGFVSLWDRPPVGFPVERLAPNANYTGEGAFGAKVRGGEISCFGTGADGYYLVMEEQDGEGLGLMWLVYTETDEDHPGEDTFASTDSFESAWASGALGAGSTPVAEGEARPDANPVAPDDLAACRWERSLEYTYRVGRR